MWRKLRRRRRRMVQQSCRPTVLGFSGVGGVGDYNVNCQHLPPSWRHLLKLVPPHSVARHQPSLRSQTPSCRDSFARSQDLRNSLESHPCTLTHSKITLKQWYNLDETQLYVALITICRVMMVKRLERTAFKRRIAI